MISAIEARFHANLDRVRGFLSLFEVIPTLPAVKGDFLREDLLRAAVVLLHGSMEDLLRSLAELKLPAAEPRFLERIPLANADRGLVGRSKYSFTLGELSAHRGSTVDELIRMSVTSHLGNSTFNNPGDVKNLVESIGVDPRIVEPYAGGLAAMIGRRHLIAHRVDGELREETGLHSPRPISIADVAEWSATVEGFGIRLLSTLRPEGLPVQGVAR